MSLTSRLRTQGDPDSTSLQRSGGLATALFDPDDSFDPRSIAKGYLSDYMQALDSGDSRAHSTTYLVPDSSFRDLGLGYGGPRVQA